eukprot:1972070-Amphidinium_carterae.1
MPPKLAYMSIYTVTVQSNRTGGTGNAVLHDALVDGKFDNSSTANAAYFLARSFDLSTPAPCNAPIELRIPPAHNPE